MEMNQDNQEEVDSHKDPLSDSSKSNSSLEEIKKITRWGDAQYIAAFPSVISFIPKTNIG